jgi:hypothetical protein
MLLFSVYLIASQKNSMQQGSGSKSIDLLSEGQHWVLEFNELENDSHWNQDEYDFIFTKDLKVTVRRFS